MLISNYTVEQFIICNTLRSLLPVLLLKLTRSVLSLLVFNIHTGLKSEMSCFYFLFVAVLR